MSSVGKGALVIGKEALTLEDVGSVARFQRKVILSEEAKEKIKASREFLLSKMESGEAIYGVNTGFGLLSNVRISDDQIETLQYNLLRSHAVGMGDPISDQAVSAMLLLRAVNLAQGHSGVRVELVEAILNLLNHQVFPLIPAQGSVGASGDLAPLAHLALTLIGEGKARYQGKILPSAEVLKKVGLEPIRLQAKEGLALINGTQFMTALGTLTLLEAEHLCDVADFSGAMSLEALRGTEAAFAEEIHSVRPHPGQVLVAKRIREILCEDGKSTISKSHLDCDKVQDPYSLRCIPQVHGATRDALNYVRSVLEIEINSVTDNPLIFAESGKILSGGNFHGQVVAMAMDFLSIALAEMGSISEQRIEKLVNPATSDLPPFLTKKSGINSGHMIVQVAAASIVSENKTLAHPACVDSIATSADKEDHVSMGAWAARKAENILVNVRRVLSMELLCATQGIDILRPLKSTPTLEKIHALIRERVPYSEDDRIFSDDLQSIEQILQERRLKTLMQKFLTPLSQF
jgi:histidine ammonia-lyase